MFRENVKHRNPLSGQKQALHSALVKQLVSDVHCRSGREMKQGLAREFPFSFGGMWPQYLELGQDVRISGT